MDEQRAMQKPQGKLEGFEALAADIVALQFKVKGYQEFCWKIINDSKKNWLRRSNRGTYWQRLLETLRWTSSSMVTREKADGGCSRAVCECRTPQGTSAATSRYYIAAR